MSIRPTIPILDYQYHLPEQSIAKYPLPERDQSKLLIYKDSNIREDIFKNIAEHIPECSFIFYNNTRVIQARLLFKKPSGAVIEVLCLAPHQPSEYQTMFSQTRNCVWECMVGNLKKWKSGSLSLQLFCHNKTIRLLAEIVGSVNNNKLVSFSWNEGIGFGTILDIIGRTPIPPYLNRESETIDKERYQTIYAKPEGSVAAPTAGMHFTNEVLRNLGEKKVSMEEITLHVGAGTFQPVKSNNALDHDMHGEFFIISRKIIESLIEMHEPITAVGTTTLRTLESLYWIAVKSISNHGLADKLIQWEDTTLPTTIPVKEALSGLLQFMNSSKFEYLTAETRIMIVPGYQFKIVNGLITNFHLPKSTLLLLIAAFVGPGWKEIYQYAQEHHFRFLSYGDSSLLWR